MPHLTEDDLPEPDRTLARGLTSPREPDIEAAIQTARDELALREIATRSEREAEQRRVGWLPPWEPLVALDLLVSTLRETKKENELLRGLLQPWLALGKEAVIARRALRAPEGEPMTEDAEAAIRTWAHVICDGVTHTPIELSKADEALATEALCWAVKCRCWIKPALGEPTKEET